MIDGRNYGYLTSEASCQLTIRTVTNIVECDGNDGNMLIFHAASNPEDPSSHCSAFRQMEYKEYSSNGKPL